MYKKAVDFIKYNNLAIIIIAIIFLLGTGVFAQTETGQAIIGAKVTQEQGEDNTLLLAADLDNMNMDYQIEKIEQDEKYYYITYTYIDLIKQKGAWLYLLQEKVRKVSKKLKKDLGQYLAEELSEENEARIKDLKAAQAKAKETGEEKRLEVVEYTGLIGQTLQLAGKVFPGYKPVKKRVLPSPSVPPNILSAASDSPASQADDLTDVYNNYINKMDPDHDNFLGVLDNCPNIYNPDQLDADNDGTGDACENKPASSTTAIGPGDNNFEVDSEASSTENIESASTTPDMITNPASDDSEASSTVNNSGDGADIQEPDNNTPDTAVATGTEVEIIELPE